MPDISTHERTRNVSPDDRPEESTSRRPDWLGGRPVRLANGQEWLLPLPEVRLAPPADPDGFPRVVTDPAVDLELLKELADVATAPPRAHALGRSFGKTLLGRNYTLTDDQAAALLGPDPDVLVSTMGSDGGPALAEVLALVPILPALRGHAARFLSDARPMGRARLHALEALVGDVQRQADSLLAQQPDPIGGAPA